MRAYGLGNSTQWIHGVRRHCRCRVAAIRNAKRSARQANKRDIMRNLCEYVREVRG